MYHHIFLVVYILEENGTSDSVEIGVRDVEGIVGLLVATLLQPSIDLVS